MKKKSAEINFFKFTGILRNPRHVFLLIIFFLSQIIFLFSDSFRLSRAEVMGIKKLKGEEVIAASVLPWGRYIWRINPSEIEKKLMSLAWVKSLVIKKGFPGKIKIYVTERDPVVVVSSSKNPQKLYGTDFDGRVLLTMTSAEAERFPHLIVDEPVSLGELIDSRKISGTIFFSQLLPVDIKEGIVSYNVDGGGYISFLYRKNNHKFGVRFGMLPAAGSSGKAEAVQAKLDILSVMLEQMKERISSIEYIDLRYTEPVIKFISAPVSETKPAASVSSPPEAAAPQATLTENGVH